MKIEIRETCKVCGKKITQKRYCTYCSIPCRNKRNNQKRADYNKEWQRKQRDRVALIASPDKVPCLVCKKWYVQVCSHAYSVHGLTGRKYREKFDLEVKRGVLPLWYRKLKGDIALDNGTYKNLKKGKKFWFKKGDKRAGKYKRSHITLERLKKGIRLQA